MGSEAYRRFLGGEEEALKEIIEEFFNPLMFYINDILHNLSVAEDLAEDTLVELVLHKGEFREEASLKTYLYRIARNKAFDYLRKEKRHPHVPIDMAEERVTETELAEQVILEEQQRQIYTAMEELPPQYREVLHLIYLEEMSNAECAKVMRKSKKQIENLLYQAKKALRLRLGDTYQEGGFGYEKF